MAKSVPSFTIVSHGIYDMWEGNSKTLPKIHKVGTIIPAEIDIEFGLTVSVKHGKGIVLGWRIEHPSILDKKGRAMAPFEGEEYVRNNDWLFYLGDTIWPPLADKAGLWRMYLSYQDEIVAEKTFEVTLDDLDDKGERMFWKRRGY